MRLSVGRQRRCLHRDGRVVLKPALREDGERDVLDLAERAGVHGRLDGVEVLLCVLLAGTDGLTALHSACVTPIGVPRVVALPNESSCHVESPPPCVRLRAPRLLASSRAPESVHHVLY